jgi:ABC-type sulfate/molybdate transport systems ATPase subunit
VLQRPLLRRGASVQANVETGLRFAGVPRRERRRRAGEWMARMGLRDLARQRASTLSGGEAQRVSLARALVLAPRLLLLDEPFSGLDAPSRAELLADLRDVLASTGASALFVSHDRHEAAAIADRLAVLHGGTVRQLGAPAAVLDHPADADCARLLGFENVLDLDLAARILAHPPHFENVPDLDLAARILAHPPHFENVLAPALAARVLERGANGAVAVRAADLRVVPGGDGAVVERVLPFPGRTRVVARVDGAVLLSDGPDTGVAAGDAVGLRVDERAARLIASA